MPSPSAGGGFFIQAAGAGSKTLFEDAGRQLFGLLIDPQNVGQALREKVAVEASDLEALLKAWITALLGLVQDQRMVFGQFQLETLENPAPGVFLLRAQALGELIDPHRHEFKQPVGSLTCKAAEIQKDSSGFTAKITIDLLTR